MTTTRPAHAVVLGASMAGTLAAHALSRHVETVIVVERDTLPEEPVHRRGVPQGRHAHLLWSNGARLIEDLLPGTTDLLLAAGARRLGFPEDLVTLTGQGWQHRFPATQFALLASRPLLDLTVRQQAFAPENITVLQRTEAVELTGSHRQVTGVVVRDLDHGEQTSLKADLVVDCTGRGSRLRQWLASLGLPPLQEDVVDAGVAYATRLFQAPPGATEHFPAVNIAADDRVREPGRFGVVYPIEGGRWIATLSCTRGAQLPSDEDAFLPFAKELNHPLVAELLQDAKPLTPVFNSRSGANRRLYPERLEEWPGGLLVLGDSLTAFNPIYGHGMSSAARAATTLAHELVGDWRHPTASRRIQQAIGAAVDDPWILAASKDVDYVNCRVEATDPRLVGVDTEQRLRFAEAITNASIRSPKASEIVTDVMSLSAPQSMLGSNRFLTAMHTDERRPKLTTPPLTANELALVGSGSGLQAGAARDGAVAQRRLGAHESAIHGSNARVLLTCELEGELDHGLLAESIRLLTEFHPLLLGSIVADGDSYVVRTGDPATQRVEFEQFKNLMEESAEAPDWLNGPLLRVAVAKAGARTTVALSLPRALVDGLSFTNLYRRLWATYTELSLGRSVPTRLLAQGLASASLDERVKTEFTERELSAFLRVRASEREAVPAVLPTRGTRPGTFHLPRIELDAERTERFVDHAHEVGLTVHSLVCGVLLSGARAVLPTRPGPVTLSCVSAVDLRTRISPPIEPESIQSGASSSTATLEVYEDTTPVELGRRVGEKLRSDLDAGVPGLDLATIPQLTEKTVPRLPTLLVTNLHKVQQPTLPPSLTLRSWKMLPLMDTPVPLAVVARFNGRLAIDLSCSGRWYAPETIDQFALAASEVFDQVIDRL